jgi:hypothetical protein
MRSMMDMDTVQIEITNACTMRCSNCTRFCGHQLPYFMKFDVFKTAIDSMVEYPKMTGFMGGEPLLHPMFKEFCEYAGSKIPPAQLGLWTALPKGYEDYREIIVKTFKHIFINDHTRDDILHHPVLVAVEEAIPDKDDMFVVIDRCWAQESWSASINPKGAYFCEIAASMSVLFSGSNGWDVKPRWWLRTPKDFKEQIEEFCPRCGFSLPLRLRSSREMVDDISLGNLERLKGKSIKIDKGEYVVHDLKLEKDPRPMAMYKDTGYRNEIAKRYGMFLVVNDQMFWTPYLYKKWSKP